MKIVSKTWGIGLLALLLLIAAPNKSKAQDESISEQDFYDNLEPYGTWVNDPQYGDVWVPDVEDDFRPYGTRGHWVLTEYGNTWVSDYPWGWATFHYGRWRYDDYYGWEWIPGYEWAPAWVSWRQGGGYYGWAPLMPGISISLSFGSSYRVPDNYWAFAPEAYINRPNIYNYYVPHTRVVSIINRTTIINNTYERNNHRYIAGPRVQDIQRITRQKPQIYTINNATRPGAIHVQNNRINIFRPTVHKAPDARPVRVVDGAAYRQQNPNQGIAHRGPGGAAAYNRANASKLAAIGRNPDANKNVVRVNNRPSQPGRPSVAQPTRPSQPNNRPNTVQPANRPDQPNRPGQPNNRPNPTPTNQPSRPNGAQPGNRPDRTDNRPNTTQPGNRPAQIGEHRGRPEDRPNVAPPRVDNNAQQQAQKAQQQQAQQQQRAQQQAQREQQRQQVQQQQQAQQAQQRQQQDQQRQQQQAQQSQQRQAQQQAQKAQQDQQRQMQQQQQQAQREQQRQAQQAQQQQQRQVQQQQQQAQRDQQRQAQQAQQQQQRQAQQQQQQVQRQQQRQQQPQQQQPRQQPQRQERRPPAEARPQ